MSFIVMDHTLVPMEPTAWWLSPNGSSFERSILIWWSSVWLVPFWLISGIFTAAMKWKDTASCMWELEEKVPMLRGF